MSRIMKVFTGLVVIVAVLAGWTWFSNRTSATSTTPVVAAGGVTSETPPSLVAPTPTAPVVSNVPGEPLPANTEAVPAGVGSVPTEASARAFAAAIVNLDERRLTTDINATQLTTAIAASGSRDALVTQALRQSALLRTEFDAGAKWFDQALRARTISISATAAVADVWWVKVVTSPSRATAGDIWGTTRFTLVWENNEWKVRNEESHLGPWPTHSRTEVQHPTGAGFAAELIGFEPIVPVIVPVIEVSK
jgi:hypothetical protein